MTKDPRGGGFALALGLIIFLGGLLAISLDRSENRSFDEVHELFPLLPKTGPNNTIAIDFIPPDILGGETNALDAAAVKFVDNNTRSIKAETAIMRCLNETYEHDHSICGRFHGYMLNSAIAVPMPINDTAIAWFWYMPLEKEGSMDKAITFAAFIDETNSSFVVDSRWIHDDYPNTIDNKYKYTLNFEIWAGTFENAYELLKSTLNNLKKYGNVSFINTVKPIPAKVFIRSAEYSKDMLRLEVQSSLPMDEIVKFNIGIRQHSNRDRSFEFNSTQEVKPGYNVVLIPAEDMLDAVVSIDVGGFHDVVYVGTGFWFAFNDPKSSTTLMRKNNNWSGDNSVGDISFAGSAEMLGSVGSPEGYVALGYALGPHGKPVDVSQYRALAFYAKGNDKLYDVLITSDSVTDYDYHRFTFLSPREGRQFIVPISSFMQKGFGRQIKFSGHDVRTVIWTPVNVSTGQTLDLFIGNAGFTKGDYAT